MAAERYIRFIAVLTLVFAAALDEANVPRTAFMSDEECQSQGGNDAEACALSAMQIRAVGRSASQAEYNAYLEGLDRQSSISAPDYAERHALWLNRKAEVELHNTQPHRLWTAAVNFLADRTDSELAELRGWRGSASSEGGSPSRGGVLFNQVGAARALPEEYSNWTTLQTTNQIMNQGACGSCWAVTSATVLNAHSEIYQTGDRFSAQELVDCIANPHQCGGDGGCKGATVELAMNYVVSNGLSAERAVPYRGRDGQCVTKLARPAELISGNFDSENGDGSESLSFHSLISPGSHVSPDNSPGRSIGLIGWERLPENEYLPLLRALYERGPVGVSVAASGWSLYSHGVFNGCSKDAVVDHAVTLIAYGIDRQLGEKYWLIQNSWGPNWGESGHVRLLRKDTDDVDHCGIDHKPMAGTGCAGGPKQVQICGMCGILYDNVVPHFA